MSIRRLANATFLAALAVLIGPRGAAADTTACTAITSIPTVITVQGIYCLKQDVASSAPDITAIEIQTNNVTLDCNGHKIGGLAAGPATNSAGIYAYDRSNITIRNCAIRGFRRGIMIYGDGSANNGSGHLVEDNRLDGNTENGIYVVGNGSVVQRNRVIDTGGRPGNDRASAISVLGDAIDNIVDGVRPAADAVNFLAEGIYSGGVGNMTGTGFVVKGNRVRNIVAKGTSGARGISLAGYGIVVRDNVIANEAAATGMGIYCSLSAVVVANRVYNYSQPIAFCYDGGGNVTF